MISLGNSFGGAGGASFNVAMAGVGATNTTTNSIEASIVGSTIGNINAPIGVTVSAQDLSDISATLVSAAVAAGGAGGFSLNISGAGVYADNSIGGTLLATIDTSSQVDTTGAVSVSASNYDDGLADGMSITATGVAVGVSGGGAGGVSVNISGAGVIAFNTST